MVGLATQIAHKPRSQNTEKATPIKTYAAPRNLTSVTLHSDEVSTIGDPRGYPDWYDVWITYTPYERIICSRSLKDFFTAQRNVIYSAEGFAQKIAEVVSASVPGQVRVTVLQKPRGGIDIEATACISRDRD